MQRNIKRNWGGCRLIAAAAMGSVLLSRPCAAQKAAGGQAQGTLTVNGQAYSLRYAYAAAIDNSADFKTMADVNTNTGVALVLADRPVPPVAVGSASRLNALTQDGKLNAVLLNFDASAKLHDGNVFCSALAAKHPGQYYSFSKDDQLYTFPRLSVAPNLISGEARMSDKRAFTADPKNQFTYQYNATFSAHTILLPLVNAILTGAAAQNSPQMQTIFASNAALLKGDLDGAQRYATPAARRDMEIMIAAQGKEKVIGMLKSLASDQQTILKHLLRIVVRGNRALVVYDGKNFIVSDSLRKVNGAWLTDVS